MLIKKPDSIRSSQVTDERLYLARRRFIQAAGIGVAGAAGAMWGGPALGIASDEQATGKLLDGVVDGPFGTDEPPNSFEHITTYNNFYEFGTGKDDPKHNAGKFNPRPWKVEVAGECDKPGVVDLDDLINPHQLEERLYRLRCVEAWSMVVPWVGVPLGPMLARFAPNSRAKYVAFETVVRPREMPGQRRRSLNWPYVEGLRIDEAMHPLTLMAVGLYGREIPNQNGAPIRLVVPWKYGFKSIKSIVKITFTEKEPPATWNLMQPREYGFYSNVNPTVDHPRWSQKRERRIGEFLKRETLMFNGYAEQVAGLYSGMDLAKNF